MVRVIGYCTSTEVRRLIQVFQQLTSTSNSSQLVHHLEDRGMMIAVMCLMLMAIASAQAQNPPNFVVIMTDDQGYDDYGFRQPPLETPTMDKLMKKGVQFTRFYTAATCAPTRSQLLTGRNFWRTGTAAVGFGGDAPHLDEYMLGEALQDAGYVTGMAGKWNLGTSDAELPSRRGFDEAWEVAGEEIRSYGKYEHYNAPFTYNGKYEGIEEGWQVEHVTDKAIDFIERHKEESFFLYLPYAQPHGPWFCPKELQEKYMNKGIGEAYAMFLGMMEHLDIQVGRVLETLEENGLSDDTIVLFYGDNGPTPNARTWSLKDNGKLTVDNKGQLNETEWAARNPTGLRAVKGTGWENGIRNRLSVYCPAKFSSKKVRDMTLVMDIYPTLLDLAGATRKRDASPLDGISLRPLLEGNGNWPKKRTYLTGDTSAPASYLAEDGWYYRFTKEYSLPLDERSTSYMRRSWVVVHDEGEWGMFNLNQDPRQENDLKSKRPEKFARLQRQYYRAFRDVRKDPHAWSDPVQVIGLPGVDDPYLEMEYAYRMKGKNDVDWTTTFFQEIGATQELKIRVLDRATYKIKLLASNVASGTKIRLRAAKSEITATLKTRARYHELGQLSFEKGDQTMAVTVLDCDDLDALPEMNVYNLRLTKV